MYVNVNNIRLSKSVRPNQGYNQQKFWNFERLNENFPTLNRTKVQIRDPQTVRSEFVRDFQKFFGPGPPWSMDLWYNEYDGFYLDQF